MDSRLGPQSVRNSHPDAAGPFDLRFNSSSRVASGEPDRAHMLKVEELVAAAASSNPDSFTHAFLDESSFTLALD